MSFYTKSVCRFLFCYVHLLNTDFLLLRGCGKVKFKTSDLRLSLSSKNILLDNHCILSDLRIAVKVRSLQFVDSNRFPWDALAFA